MAAPSAMPDDFGPVVTIAMANAAHAVTLGEAGSAETRLTGRIIYADPGGGAQTLSLPTAASGVEGILFVVNAADAAEVLTVDDGSTTIATLAQNEMCVVVSDGTTYRSLVGLNT